MKQYKQAREGNPGLKYWEWKAIPKYDEGGKVIPTQEEYIAEQIAARKAAALEKSLSRTTPRVPQGIKTGERWNPITKKVEDILECGPSCAYTFSDNYGQNWMGSEDFKQNHTNYGWKQVPWEQRQPGNAVLIVDDSGTAKHTMMYDSDNAQGQPLFNHSNGGHDESAIRKKAKYPHHNPYLTYEFVGTPADSTQWINDYKKLYGFADGGEVGDNDFMKQFGKQVSYKPEETSWWSNVKNWWNDLTGMKNYAYGNCATTPNGKHTKECAHYSNSVLRNRGYKNIVGDAWTRAANSGMKKITSGYDGLTKPTEWDESDAHDYLQSAANNFINNVDTTALNPYDVIGLYYPDSPNTKKAFEQGRWGETQTHTGHIAVGNDGTHYVVHNVGGHLKMNKLADMLTGDYDYLPVSAYRPKK